MSTFTPSSEQSAIIDYADTPLRVSAGAGTGKTTTIVQRLAHAVSRGGDPSRALGVTFTNKAADELRSRLREAIGSTVSDREVEVATYHSFAGSILEEFGARIGRETGDTLMDDGHRSELASRVLRSLEDTPLDLTSIPTRRKEMLTVADALNENLIDASVLASVAPAETDETWSKRLALAEAASAFHDAKRHLGLYEYSDLLMLACQIVLEHPDVAAQISSRYDTVLLDEYQDTDPAQRLLLVTLFGSGTSVTAVGDTDQTIYEWRGASIDNFDSFPTDFPTSGAETTPTLPLSVNRRSDKIILDLANAVRAALPPVEGSADLRPVADAEPGTLMTAWFLSDREEAAWIAAEILARRETGVAYSDMAVLCRKRESLRPISLALESTSVPFAIDSMGELLQVPEVADVVAWLRILADPREEIPLLRILLGGKYRLGMSDIATLRRVIHADSAMGLLDILLEPELLPDLPEPATAAVLSFTDKYRQLFVSSNASSVAATVDDILVALDYWAEISALDPTRTVTTRINVNRFLDVVDQWRPLDGRPTLVAFLRYLDALDETGRADALDAAQSTVGDAVRLLTAHGAKGLEWSDVYIPAIADKVFPGTLRRFPDPETAATVLPYSVRLDQRAVAPFMDSDDQEESRQLMRSQHRDQEWRLAYVAVTRAKHRLVMTGHAWDGDIKNPRQPGLLFDIARNLDGSLSGPMIEEALPRPRPEPYDEPPVPPDPLFESDSNTALRRTIMDPEWIDDEYPDLQDEVAERVAQLSLRLADLREPHVDAPSPPFTASVTNLVALAECPLKFKWIHHDRLPRKPRLSATKGTQFHRRVELHNLGVVALDDAAVTPYEAMAAVGGNDAPAPSDPWETFLASRFFAERPIRVETPFEITFDDRTLRGKVDAVYGTSERWEIVDYKSGRSRPSSSRDVQLQAYALAADGGALGGDAPASIDVTFAYFGDDAAVELTERADPSWMEAAKRRITDLLAIAENGPFPAAPSPMCVWCDFLHHCDAGRAFTARLPAV